MIPIEQFDRDLPHRGSVAVWCISFQSNILIYLSEESREKVFWPEKFQGLGGGILGEQGCGKYFQMPGGNQRNVQERRVLVLREHGGFMYINLTLRSSHRRVTGRLTQDFCR